MEIALIATSKTNAIQNSDCGTEGTHTSKGFSPVLDFVFQCPENAFQDLYMSRFRHLEEMLN
jgi:hypothetical protein